MPFWRFCLGALLCLLVVLPARSQDVPVFQEWLDDDSFLVSKGFGENLYLLNIPALEDSAYVAPSPLNLQLPDSLSDAAVLDLDEASASLVLSHLGNLYYWQADAGITRISNSPLPEENPTFSPDGKNIAYTRGGNLFSVALPEGKETALTDSGNDTLRNGYASWVYFEEILGRSSNYKAFYWSPDSRSIAYLRFDDRPVPEFPIFHNESGDSIHGMLEMTRYPKAGDNLPLVSLHVVQTEYVETLDLEGDPDLSYFANVQWAPGGSDLFFQQMSREQDLMRVYHANSTTGATKLILEEESDTWLTFRPLEFLEGSPKFLYASDRSGWVNLYLYDFDGLLERQLTDVSWNVGNLKRVDEERERVFFEGPGEKNTELHLFSIQMNGDSLRQITQGEGYHKTYISPEGNYFVDRHSRFDDPGSLALHSIRGELLKELGRAEIDPNKEAGMFVEQFTVPTQDGFDLPAYWVLPPGFDPTQLYPLVFYIYGGPNSGSVNERFRDFSDDHMLQNGVIRFVIDHRGSGKFGKKGLDQLHRNLGFWELNDYTDAVYWLREQTFIDTTRIGIRGGSYGGYLAALALTKGSDLFTHGVARAPVTDWRLYNNVYTERYMDTPEENPDGYKDASVLKYAPRLRGKLLLIHGTIDDNVHMQHTVQLVSRFQDLGKEFELMIYPGGRHGWGGSKRLHAQELEENFFLNHFFGNRGGAQ